MNKQLLDSVSFSLRLGRYKYFKDSEFSVEDVWDYGGQTCYWPGGNSDYYPYFRELTDIEKKTVSRFTNQTEYEYINHGTGRVVFKKDTYVIKMARFGASGMLGDGVSQNCIEWNRYTEYKNSCKYLIPVIQRSNDFNWIKMPYINKKLTDKKESVQSKISNKIESSIQSYFKITDCKPKNIGYYDDEWGLLDYGQPEKTTL